MGGPYRPLEAACAVADTGGAPRSPRYDDVYHSSSGAFGQAAHVFLGGNDLPTRWRGRNRYTVCETGFGLGCNFLALWRAWRCDPRRCARLHVISFELHPFSRSDLAAFLFPLLSGPTRALGDALLAAWPPLLPGLHRLEFESGAVTLTLGFGPARALARQVEASVDAFFLDGFSPRKNPEMWAPDLFGQLVRMANRGATAATWCCASSVRGALRDAGFQVAKAPGFGRKREMTVATLRPTLGHAPFTSSLAAGRVLVIGGGFAGAGVAHCLALRGIETVVIDPVFTRGPGANQHGHLAAAMTPRITRDDDRGARLARAGMRQASLRWAGLPPVARPVRCGALWLAGAESDAARHRATLGVLGFPREWVRWVERDEACDIAGMAVARGGVFLPEGRWLRPEPLLAALFGRNGVVCLPATVGRLVAVEGGWSARDENGGEIAAAPVAVLANAGRAAALLRPLSWAERAPRVMSMEEVAGQVSYFRVGSLVSAARVIVSARGRYWLPPVDGVGVAGGTYAPSGMAAVSEKGHREIAARLATLLCTDVDAVMGRLAVPAGWAGRRAVASGRLPVIGRIAGAPGLWAACGYGSRGLTWSALAGEIVAAALAGEPVPLERDLLRAVAPG
ncbi:MAG: FAD-dependent oxidoreductase [Candidimonas sp.]|nr:MAG: FAD-dependent oxidoreductase [Candidimonas sp.]